MVATKWENPLIEVTCNNSIVEFFLLQVLLNSLYRQGFAKSLQQECSKPAQNLMIELYCCGPRSIVLATTLPK